MSASNEWGNFGLTGVIHDRGYHQKESIKTIISGDLLQNELKFSAKIRNEHILLSQYFLKIFQVPPRYTYIDNTAIFIFLSKKPHEIVCRKMHMEMNYFMKNFTKRIYLIALPNTFGEFIQALFPSVKFDHLKSEGSSIYAYLPDHQMPIALGKEGYYIRLGQ